MLVWKIMQTNYVSVGREDSAEEAARRMKEKDTDVAIVVDGEERPIGIVTERDLVKRVLAEGRDPRDTKVSEIMSWPVVVIDRDSTVFEAAKLMRKFKVRHLPVVENGRVVGVLSVRDVMLGFVSLFVKGKEEELLSLLDFIYKAGRLSL